MILTWYTYFSYWVFIWFLIFKMGIVEYSPYLIYLGIVIFISVKLLRDIWYYNFKDTNKIKNNKIKNNKIKNNKIKNNKIKNNDVIISWVFTILVVDIIPFFYLERNLGKESIIFTLILGAIYISVMNSLNINIISHYSVMNYREIEDNYTMKTFWKELFSIS